MSVLSSKNLIGEIYRSNKENPGFAVQKFTRLLVSGILKNNVKVKALSTPPIRPKWGKWVKPQTELENEITYHYAPFINIPIIKHICVFLYTFFYILNWGIKHKKENVVLCDALTLSMSIGALFASKLSGIKIVGVVTDLLGLIVGGKTFKNMIASKIYSRYIALFDSYILLTEQMNEVVNPKKKPYIIMEALCDIDLNHKDQVNIPKDIPRVVMYAGGIYEQYGLKLLAEAFVLADIEDAKLVYYGSGPYVQEYKELCKMHSNLEYAGVAPNQEVVNAELRATLLVNPRFSAEEFTKYSFPSKNMEFMVSGTPVLTTRLPGMPKEYLPYVFIFEKETLDGFADTLKKVMSYSSEKLDTIGANAKRFVLDNKNNIDQGKRIVDFVFSIL